MERMLSLHDRAILRRKEGPSVTAVCASLSTS